MSVERNAQPEFPPLVMKFGGTSVADAACLRRVGALVGGLKVLAISC